MSYEFKKLSDVNVIEEVKDDLSVLAVDNGEVVKVAADKIGGGSGGSAGGKAYIIRFDITAEGDKLSSGITYGDLLIADQSDSVPDVTYVRRELDENGDVMFKEITKMIYICHNEDDSIALVGYNNLTVAFNPDGTIDVP